MYNDLLMLIWEDGHPCMLSRFESAVECEYMEVELLQVLVVDCLALKPPELWSTTTINDTIGTREWYPILVRCMLAVFDKSLLWKFLGLVVGSHHAFNFKLEGLAIRIPLWQSYIDTQAYCVRSDLDVTCFQKRMYNRNAPESTWKWTLRPQRSSS